ncbi:hypothetical protein BMS3Abin04_02534 [bacterium BMS3Abin04]|nr:hypothetical protein BMS3Abin04_02534 [bacterium BMS3Abin04]
MKRMIPIFIALLFVSILSFAQGKNYQLNMRMVIESPDTQSVILNYSGAPDKAIEGYYLQPRFENIYTPNAALRKGGFSFLDANIFGGFVETLSKKWIKNNFPITNLASMTNGLAPAKVLSFQIKPIIVDEKSDTLNLLVKYAVFNYWNNRESELNFTPHVQLFYKWLRVKYNMNSELKIFNKLFDKHKFIVKFWKGKDKGYTIKNNDRLFEAIKKSAEESKIHNINFSFDIGLICTDKMDKFNFLAKYQEENLPAAKTLINKDDGEVVKLPRKVYYGRLLFPFVLYNTEKAKRYSKYKTRKKIFQSTYNIVIVPISMTDDSLTCDLFLNYSKLNLNDGIPRWTPIKKRITVSKDLAFAEVVLPKENWSANFTRKGERYDIYGYSDFEQFVDEKLQIKFKVLK